MSEKKPLNAGDLALNAADKSAEILGFLHKIGNTPPFSDEIGREARELIADLTRPPGESAYPKLSYRSILRTLKIASLDISTDIAYIEEPGELSKATADLSILVSAIGSLAYFSDRPESIFFNNIKK